MPVNFVHKCLNPFVFNSILKNKDTVKNKKKQISLGQVKLIIKHMKCIKNMGLQFNALRPAFTMFVTQLDVHLKTEAATFLLTMGFAKSC